MLFLTLRLFNELARRPGRVLIVCYLLSELRATVEQLASRVTDGTISVMKLTVAFVFDGTKQHSWRSWYRNQLCDAVTEMHDQSKQLLQGTTGWIQHLLRKETIVCRK